jgi:MazG family protein
MAEQSADPIPVAINNQPSTISFAQLCEIVAKLRAPGGCPWDREQTHESLLTALIEEAYEVAGAVRAKDSANFREELGDLLLLIVMHAEIASESDRFDINGVLKDVTEKLIRRHPHVFGKSNARDSNAVLKQWESIKSAEKKGKPAGDTGGHYLDDLPAALPALMRAQKAQSKVARVNFDWTEVGNVIEKVEEEIQELKQAVKEQDRKSIEDEVGDLLFVAVNLARKCKLDAERALQAATDKFVVRFNRLEDELQSRGKRLGDVDLVELDAIWNQIKTENAQRSTSNAQSPTSELNVGR